MDLDKKSEALVGLGKKLVVELGLDDSVDTLGRWMAHYLAELIEDCQSEADSTDKVRAELRDTVLALWAHRAALPDGKRPLEDFEPVFETLSSLRPSGEHRYARVRYLPEEMEGESPEAVSWLDLARQIDFASKSLIDYCISSATEKALDQAAEWVQLQEDAGVEEEPLILVIRAVRDRSEVYTDPDPDEEKIRELSQIKKNLEIFGSRASELLLEITEKLDALPVLASEPKEDTE
ncbi:MAG: hypothetical protein ABJ308_03000 [Halieaceae bacterium]